MSTLAYRLTLMARALARSDRELNGNRHRYVAVQFALAQELIGAGL
jgi:hypothetical protein